MFSSDAAAKPQRKKMVVLTLHYCHYLLYFLCVSLRRSSLTLFYLLYFCVKKMVPGSGSVHLHYLLYFCVFLCGLVPGSVHLHYLLYFCVFLCGEAAEKKMVVFTLHYLLYFCVFLCGEAAEKKMVVFTYNYFAAQPQRKI